MNNINNEITGTGSDNVTHLSFEKYFEGDWRKYFHEKETVLRILDAAGLSATHEFVQINSRYLIDDNRAAVIVLLKKKNTEVLDKLIIDVIASTLLYEQCMEVIYNIGSDCDYRIILYDVNTKNYSKGLIYCEHLMCDLIDLFDGLISMSFLSVDCIRNKENIFNIIFNKFKEIKKFSDDELPDRSMFDEAEFWNPYVGSFLGGDFPCCYGFIIQDSYSSSYDYPGIESVWTADGILVKGCLDDIDEQVFRKLIEEFMNECSESFEGCSVEYEDGEMIVKKDIPFRNFSYSLPVDKWKMVEEFFLIERGTLYFIDEYLPEALK